MNKMMQVTNASKIYKMGEVEVLALDDVSFEIYEGEFVVILGPSGSGKSTLLNIMGGMDTATKGRVFFKEDEITKYTEKQLTFFRRNMIGFVFQFYNLMANLTAKENIELATEISKNALDVDKVLESVGLEDRKNHFPSQMSGGEQQRVAIARAICKNPEMLLCDEPTGALDFKTGISILKLLDTINKEFNKSVIIITHNAGIANMADRVIKMRSGKIIDNYTNSIKIDPERIEW
jgi:putative ABC transport system ATP-binding protein